jgi:alkylated DNA repair dioxygenase AlkB
MIPVILATILLLLILVAGFLAQALCDATPGGRRSGLAAVGGKADAFADVEAVPAAPLEVRALKPQSNKWRFREVMPKDLKSVPERIWFVKKTIRSKTSFADESTPIENPIIPDGFRIWQPPSAATTLLADARREIAALFERELALPEAERMPFSDQRGSRGLYYVFTRDLIEARVSYNEARAALRAATPALADFCHEHLLHLARIYRLSPGDIAKKAQLVLLRYEPGSGIWLHIDNVARYDRGPIVTISLGPPDVTYDLTPTLTDKGVPIRVRMREGDLVIMDGRSRMEWAHGVPYGLETYKYTVMFKCDHLTEHVVGYQPILQTNIYEAIPGGVRHSVRKPEKADDPPPQKGDILGGFAG